MVIVCLLLNRTCCLIWHFLAANSLGRRGGCWGIHSRVSVVAHFIIGRVVLNVYHFWLRVELAGMVWKRICRLV